MSAQVLDLTARQHESRVLGNWLANRDGGAARAGVHALGENAVSTGLSYSDLANVIGASGMASSGQVVTPQTALSVSAVYACIDRIIGAISTMPLGIFERLPGDDRQPVEHDYHWMLNERACEEFSAADAWCYMLACRYMYGDGYAELLRPSISSSRVIGWRPHHSNRVQPFREFNTGRKYYRVQPIVGAAYTLDQADMVQITSLGYDGLTSPSPITYAAREPIGVALAGQQFAGKFFTSGASFDYALKTSANMNEKQREELLKVLMARAATGGRSPLILWGGLEPAQLTINPKDAEILATRSFSVEEICRIFGVPPFLIGHTEKSTSWGTGMEQQGSNFVRYTLLPTLVKIAQEFNFKLWPVRSRYFIEHNPAGLQKGDMKSRFESYRTALGRAGEQPFMSPDEVRRAENLPPRKLAANAPASAPAPEPDATPAPAPAPEHDLTPDTETGATHAA